MNILVNVGLTLLLFALFLYACAGVQQVRSAPKIDVEVVTLQ